MLGTIKVKLNGFGFIASSETESDTFFHAKQLPEDVEFDDLNVGDALSFDIGEGNNGKPQAINIALAESDDA